MTMAASLAGGPAGSHDADARRAGQRQARAASADLAYRAATRHSRLVRFLRVAIPLGAVVSLLAFIVFPFLNPFRLAGVSVGAVRMDGSRVTMENPRLAGHRKDNKPYEVTATSAVQDIRVPNIIELNQMKARLVNTDDTVINLTSNTAVFDSAKEQLNLMGDVRVTTPAGQEVLMKSADVDFKAGTVRSTDGVTVRLPDMSVVADQLDVTDNGSKIAFIGRVSALIDDKDSAGAKAAPVLAPASPAVTPGQPSGRTTRVPQEQPLTNRGADARSVP